MPNTYLTVPFKEKDSVKALGTLRDSDAKRWYVLEAQDLAPFATWLPSLQQASTTRAVAPPTEAMALQAAPRGIPLFRLLQGKAKDVAHAYSTGVSATAEVLRASVTVGHVYLELSERNADGRVLAKANATIWARAAERIVPEFLRATGAIRP